MKRHSSITARGAWCVLGLLLLLLLSSSAYAQAGTSTVRGTVTDPQNNVVAGATVTLISLGTNTARTQTTNESGAYVFDFVQPGDYRIEVEARGFRKEVVTDVHALVAKPTDVSVKLEVGDVTGTVTVSSGAGEVLVNKEDATLGNNFVAKQITELPIDSRNVPGLLTLQPGVTRDGYVTGARSDQSNITLDGVDINEAQTNSVGTVTDNPTTAQLPTNNTVLRLNAEAIEEFRVTTTNPNANQGRSSGGQIALVTKAGTNDFHGALFEFHRPTVLSANDFFNNRNGRFTASDTAVLLGQAKVGDLRNPRPTLIRNVFGGAVGGPIIKDRVFFFYSYEARRQVSQSTVVRTVPLASLGRGELRYRNPSGGVTTLTTAQLNSIFPAVGMNPAAISALATAAAKYPANDFTVGDSRPDLLLNTAGFRFNAPTPVRLNSHSGRFDFNLTSKQLLFVRTNIIYDLTTQAPQFPDTPRPNVWSHPWGFVAGHTWTINNRMVNNFRYGLTREAFTQAGDSAENAISFRFVFSPLAFTRTLTRTTPVQNITDDLSWTKGNHSLQFGTNIRIIRNSRTSFANAFDNAIANPSFYAGGAGASLSTPVNNFSPIAGSRSGVQNAVSALIGRFSQYTANFTFDRQGNLLSAGSPSKRNFATEEYEGYVQDVWKFRPNLTITAGLRYSLSRPVYETNGLEVKTNIPLSDYFAKRLVGAAAGTPFFDPIILDLSGPANGRSPLYDWDKNNFQPRIAVAWSPAFKNGFLGRVFGRHNESVIRGGFAITNDYYGEQLAVSFDLNNTVGFSSNQTIAANTFNTTTRPGPLFTGFGQPVRTLPRITLPGQLIFPKQESACGANCRRIESSLDSKLVAPVNYSWNATFERALPKGLVVQASYIGRYAKNLIATRDVMALNNLVDPKSGMDWYTAGGILEQLRAKGVPTSAIQPIPYFQNLFPANLAALINANYFGDTVLDETLNQTQAVYSMGLDVFDNDWTDTQDALDQAVGKNLFFQPQYGALAAFSSIAKSWYHAGTVSVRERLGRRFTMDFNYTLSHSLDDASGLQTSAAYGAAFILNPIRQRDWYADSDFDVRHIININALWELPFGRGRRFLSNTNKYVNALLGGWQLSGIYRWNSGLPISAPYDDARWATNWNVQSYAIRLRPIQACPTRGGIDPPKLFGCDPNAAYQSFRNARPGESGDRAPFRLPGYVALDMGIAKEFTMPWSERHKLQLRFEAFNITNTQRLGTINTSRTGYGITIDPSGNPGLGANPKTPPVEWSNFTAIQGKPREMQFGFRYIF